MASPCAFQRTQAENHTQITEPAALRFREQGIDGIGVAGLMQSLGLTHGGFYAHFESKDVLVAEAARRVLPRRSQTALDAARHTEQPAREIGWAYARPDA